MFTCTILAMSIKHRSHNASGQQVSVEQKRTDMTKKMPKKNIKKNTTKKKRLNKAKKETRK